MQLREKVTNQIRTPQISGMTYLVWICKNKTDNGKDENELQPGKSTVYSTLGAMEVKQSEQPSSSIQ